MGENNRTELIPDPTPEMIAAGVAAIEPFDLQDAVEGYLGRDELVTAIFLAMVRAQERSA
jgi:hypothetical protein